MNQIRDKSSIMHSEYKIADADHWNDLKDIL